MGNASECKFWNDPRGTPPNLFSINISCTDPSPGGGGGGGGGFENPSDPPPGGSPGVGGTGPVNGGGPPKNGLTPSNCQQGLDCEECNIPGDTNGDCILSYDEVVAMNSPCTKTKAMLARPNVQQIIKDVKEQALKTLSNIDTGEIGFKEKKDGTIAPADVNADHHVIFNDVTDGIGGYHNHTASGMHIFSPPDVDALLGFAAAQSLQDGAGNAYLGMIAAEWCNTCPPDNKKILHYVIRYTGPTADLGTGGSHVYTEDKMVQLEKDYQETIDNLTDKSKNGTTYIKVSDDLNEKGLEKLLFETLKNMKLTGKVNLQRVEADGTVNNMTFDSNGTATPIPCP